MRVYARRVKLSESLATIAGTAEEFAAPAEHVNGVLVAEPAPGEVVYVCAYEGPAGLTWLALQEDGTPVTSRNRVNCASRNRSSSPPSTSNFKCRDTRGWLCPSTCT